MHKHGKYRLDTLSTEELVDKAHSLIADHSFREAIDVYKQLLKREQREEWRNGLADAYLQRAQELAAKSMYKEAAILWENRVTLCAVIGQPDLYIDWLIQAGQYAKAAQAFVKFQEEPETKRLEPLFAALSLVGRQDLALPPDSALTRHNQIAIAALDAYCQGADANAVKAHLQGIGFRSPYKDLRALLNALLKLEESNPAEAVPLFKRIPDTSPFSAIARIAQISATGDLAALSELSPAQRDLASRLLGLNEQRNKLLKQWVILQGRDNDKARLNFVLNHLSLLDREQARQSCIALLITYPQGLRSYNQHFGPLPTFEEQRLKALQAEAEDDLDRAVYLWRACANLLRENSSHPDNALKAALILRHIIKMEEQLYGKGASVMEDLEACVQLDPDDKQAYLELARLHKEAGNKKVYYQWVEQAVQRFPEDTDTLWAATESAADRKAFKKAAGFAQRLLQLDPINNQARSVLIDAHLSHARKLIKSGKYPLAEKELDNAGQFQRESTQNGLVEINRGLLAHHRQQPEAATQAIRVGAQLAGGRLLACLRVWVEAVLLDLDPDQCMAYLDKETAVPSSREEVLALAKLINHYRAQGFSYLDQALEALEPSLKKAAKQTFSEEELRIICECLYQTPHYELLEYYATAALKRWRDRPIFVYYQTQGRGEGDVDALSDRDYKRLEKAAERARAHEDTRTAMRIDKFLDQSWGSGALDAMPPPPEDIFEAMERLSEVLKIVPPHLKDKLLDELLQGGGGPPDDIPLEVKRKFLDILADDFGDDFDDDFDDEPPIGPFPHPLFDPFFDPSGPSRRSSGSRKKKPRKKRRR